MASLPIPGVESFVSFVGGEGGVRVEVGSLTECFAVGVDGSEVDGARSAESLAGEFERVFRGALEDVVVGHGRWEGSGHCGEEDGASGLHGCGWKWLIWLAKVLL